MRAAAFAVVLAGALVLSPVAGAQAPSVEPPEGAELTHDEEADYDAYPLPVASFAGASPTVGLAGAVHRRAWRLSAAERTVASVAKQFRGALERQGLSRLLDCAGEECGGFDFRFGAEVLPPPAMAMDVRDFAQITAGRTAPAAYASVLISQVRDSIYIQAVTVVPEQADLDLVATPLEPLPETELQVPPVVEESDGSEPTDDRAADDGGAVSPAPGPGDDVPEDGRPLLDRLLEYGHVPVAGLAFATGGAQLTGDSGAALDEMAKMLTDNQDLDVAIVGHSDNVGPLNVNIELSRRRAAAVRTALIERGVRAERLEARGVGYLAPRRSNATEEGRALNRRVELVLR